MSPFGEGDPERRPKTEASAAEDTVRRAPGPNAEYVRRLLKHLQRYEWPGAPRLLGVDEHGYDVFTPYPGWAASSPYQPPAVWSDRSLARVARLLRQLHDLTVGTACAGDAEVACHNDVTPANTVYRQTADGLRPCGFVNWDLAWPGRRVHDLAYACWRFLDLGPGRSEPSGPARLMRLMCDSYELGRADRGDLVDTVLWWQERVLAEERHRLGLAVPLGQGETDASVDATGIDGTALPPGGSEANPEQTPAKPSPPLPLPNDDGLTESVADIQASIDWVYQYGDILDAVVTARRPPPVSEENASPLPAWPIADPASQGERDDD